ncbi:MAG: right-handed parallel beta-helix repeat-containing protein [Planctomycetota bacterium]|nr:right-handed parallel beta-helix repeat-containing protein [Planctomycetota bacterium]
MRLLIIGLGAALTVAAQGGTILYVDDDAPPGGDGAGWDTAYRFLQDALADASGEIETIRVAQGIYRPDRDEANPDGTGERDTMFELINGVSIMGGHAGLGADDPDARDIVLYETILTGDLAGDDAPGFVNIAENSLHVISGAGRDATAILDGFTITGGNADDTGADCGGGMYNEGGSPTVIDCTFTANAADAGGGMCNINNSSPNLTGCAFVGNRAVFTGGGMYNSFGSDPALTDCAFTANTSDNAGGGMYSTSFCEPTLIGCTFADNEAASFGGGIDTAINCHPFLVDCRFTGNVASSCGGAMVNDETEATVINCTFADNESSCGGGAYNSSAEVTFANSVFLGNAAERGGAMSNLFAAPHVVNGTFSLNTASEAGGALHNEADSNAALANCILWDNSAPTAAEIANVADSMPRIAYCDIESSGGSGGGWDTGLGIDAGGNLDADPLFADPPGGDFGLSPSSPAIDAGLNNAVPADTLDLDADGETGERLPLDRAGAARFADASETPDSGCGLPVIVDMGAYEFPDEAAGDVKIGDVDGNGVVDVVDLLLLLGDWGPCETDCCLTDLDASGTIDTADLQRLLGNWG